MGLAANFVLLDVTGGIVRVGHAQYVKVASTVKDIAKATAAAEVHHAAKEAA
jgi:hypothetical protein